MSVEVRVSPKPMRFLLFNHFLTFHTATLSAGWLESLGVPGPVLGAEGASKAWGWLAPTLMGLTRELGRGTYPRSSGEKVGSHKLLGQGICM